MDCAFDGAPKTCQLDTGAGDKIVVEAASGFQRYPAISTSSNINSDGVRQSADLIQIGDLRLGGLDLGPLRAKRRSGPPRPPMIGPQAVTKGAFALRFIGKARLLLDAAPPPVPLQPLLPFDRDRHLLMTVSVGSDTVSALFDTGSGLSEVDAGYAAARPDQFLFRGEYMRLPGRPDAKLYRMRSLTVGGRRLEDVSVMASDFSLYRERSRDATLRLMLGYDVATRADWYFDLARRRWGLYP